MVIGDVRVCAACAVYLCLPVLCEYNSRCPFPSYDELLVYLSVFMTKQGHLKMGFLMIIPNAQSLSSP